MRQGILREYDPTPGVSVSALDYEYPAHAHVPDHAHESDQLLYAIEGVMEVSAGRNIWTVPPQFALWIPARTFHRIEMPGRILMRTLYFRPGVVRRQDAASSLIYVTPLLRELIVEAVRLGRLRVRNRMECALRDVLVGQLEKATPAPIFLTMPSEPRARTVGQLILRDLADIRPLAVLCADAGVSVRTVQRIFRRELGTDIETWRRQARLTKAVQLLVDGSSVKEVSHRVGYQQPSAFVESFRKLFNSTPRAWTAALRAAEPASNSVTRLRG